MAEPKQAEKAIEINLPVTLEPRPGDSDLTPDQLRAVSFFKRVKDTRRRLPRFEEYPGAIKLRFYRQGEEIWRQGEAGFTAFYILTAADLLKLQESHDAVRTFWEAGASGTAAEEKIGTAYLAVPRQAERTEPEPKKWSLWKWLRGERSRDLAAARKPLYIPFDGPADLNYETLQTDMYQGELFGEASCLDGLPRSATAIAQRDWYLLEMTSNILTRVQEDEGYKEYQDSLYKKRGMAIQLRTFSLFQDLEDEEFQQLLGQFLTDLDSKKPEEEKAVALISRKHGEVIFDEHDQSDSMFVIHGGLVKVSKNQSPLFGREDVLDWPKLGAGLAEGAHLTGQLKEVVWKHLAPFHPSLRAAALRGRLHPSRQQEIVSALNELVKKPSFTADPNQLAGLTHPTADLVAEARAPERTKNPRRFNRLVLEALYPGALRQRWATADPELILAYCSHGETIGEIGVILGQPRSASCVAYVHERGSRAEVTLLRISARAVAPFLRPGSALYEGLKREAEVRTRQTEDVLAGAVRDVSRQTMQSERFKELSLIQGQRLMLIDLQRCTRCDECVQACVTTHADGYSRLFLDGPRYGHDTGAGLKNYLVPTTCRACLNPECMTGCPVGSIHRGNQGQMVIENWCIGCQRCALFCPYGAIQMHDIGLVPRGAFGWRYARAAAVREPAWEGLEYDDRSWTLGQAPFIDNRDFRENLPGPTPDPGASPDLYFRYTFVLVPAHQGKGNTFPLRLRSLAAAVAVRVNGQELDLKQHPKMQKKQADEWNYEAVLAEEAPAPLPPLGEAEVQRLVRPGRNVIAVRVVPSGGDVLLDLGLYKVAPPVVPTGVTGTFTEGLVIRQAVVCDLCRALPDGPACVKACPHEAAIRFDARGGVPVW